MQKTCRHIKTGVIAQYLGSGLAFAYSDKVKVHVLLIGEDIVNWIDSFFLADWTFED